ncbi:HalOD1 output domain-containing protein [Natrialbaceae archaeon A-arb3/5]
MTDGGFEVQTEYADKTASIETLLQSLAVAEDTRITELDPLYESVEPEALCDLLRHASTHDCLVGVEFVYGELTVTISETGTIRIHDNPPELARTGGERNR